MQQTSETVTAVIVNAYPLFGRGLMAVIEASGTIKVIGQAARAEEAMHMITELQPDVVLAVTQAPLPDYRQTVQSIRTTGFTGGVIVLDSLDTEEEHFKIVEMGADGCLLKALDQAELLSTIIHASHGRDLV